MERPAIANAVCLIQMRRSVVCPIMIVLDDEAILEG
jgi:hypothetical protein